MFTPFAFFQGVSTPPVSTYLLDTYPGANIAYSIRRLNSAYTGSAFQAQRVSDSAVQDIGFIGENLDTAALTTFAAGGDTRVKIWYDQSGNGRNLTGYPNAATIPSITNTSGVIETNANGNIALKFGVNKALTLTFPSAVAQPTHYFTVNENTIPSRDRHMVDGAGVNRQLIGYTWENENQVLFAGAILNGGIISTNTIILESLFNGVNSKLAWNNLPGVTGNAGNNSLQPLYLGTGSWFGSITEFIQYASNQTANSVGIKTNQNTYYSVY